MFGMFEQGWSVGSGSLSYRSVGGATVDEVWQMGRDAEELTQREYVEKYGEKADLNMTFKDWYVNGTYKDSEFMGYSIKLQSGETFLTQDLLMDVTGRFYAQLARTELFYTTMKEKFDKESFSIPGNKLEEKLRFFANTIGHEKQFDIKQLGKGFNKDEIGRVSIFEGTKYDWTAYGNINYGYAARFFGIPLDDALTAAGIQQVFGNGEGKPDWGNFEGMFDQYMDTEMIKMGYHFAAPWDR